MPKQFSIYCTSITVPDIISRIISDIPYELQERILSVVPKPHLLEMLVLENPSLRNVLIDLLTNYIILVQRPVRAILLKDMINVNVHRSLELLKVLFNLRRSDDDFGGGRVKIKMAKFRVKQYTPNIDFVLDGCDGLDMNLYQFLSMTDFPARYGSKVKRVVFNGLQEDKDIIFTKIPRLSLLNNVEEINIISFDDEDTNADVVMAKLAMQNKTTLKKCTSELELSLFLSTDHIPSFQKFLNPDICEFDVIVRDSCFLRSKLDGLLYQKIKYFEFEPAFTYVPDDNDDMNLGDDDDDDCGTEENFEFISGFVNAEVVSISLNKFNKSLIYGTIQNFSLKKMHLSRQKLVRFNLANFANLKELNISNCIFNVQIDFLDTLPTSLERFCLDICQFNESLNPNLNFHLPQSIIKLYLVFLPIETNFNLNELSNLRELAYFNYQSENLPYLNKLIKTMVVGKRSSEEINNSQLDLSKFTELNKLVLECSEEQLPIIFPPNLTFLELYNPIANSTLNVQTLSTIKYFSLSDASPFSETFSIKHTPCNIKNFRYHGKYTNLIKHLDIIPDPRKLDRLKIEIDFDGDKNKLPDPNLEKLNRLIVSTIDYDTYLKLILMQQEQQRDKMEERLLELQADIANATNGGFVSDSDAASMVSGVDVIATGGDAPVGDFTDALFKKSGGRFSCGTSKASLVLSDPEYPLFSNECIWDFGSEVDEWFIAPV